MENAANRILKFIKKMDPRAGWGLEREIAGMTEDEQFDRVMQVLDSIKPPEPRTAGGSALSTEDRALVERFEAGVERMEGWAERSK